MNEYTMLVDKILIENNIFDIKVVETDEPITLTYEALNNELRINTENVENYVNNNYDFFLNTDDEILTIMTYHEIGHYLDFKANKNLFSLSQELKFSDNVDDWKNFVLERERMAWELGKAIVPSELKDAFDKLNTININSYEKKLSQ